MRSKLRTLPYLLLLLPFDLVVAFCLCASVPLCFRKYKDTETQRTASSTATIVIVNWDGKHLLEESLPALIEAVKCDGRPHEIMVVDNGSTDGSIDFVRQNFPSVQILSLDRNYGFSEGNNRGIAEVRTDIVVLLNNDMIVDRGFLGPLLDGFSDSSVFAVTSQIFFHDATRRREETGKTRARFEHGFFYLWHDDLQAGEQSSETIPVFWAGGGSCAVDRKKYVELGGFDSLYHPFYLEDTDLSYQAWKRGWKCLLAPASRVIHKHRSTSKTRFGEEFVENTVRKNQYLFLWKNLIDVSLVSQHLVNLPRIHARAMFNHAPWFEIRAFFRAFRQLPGALRRRVRSASHYSVSDREVLLRTQKPAGGPEAKK
jgi:O-antigen biosynthesis protein